MGESREGASWWGREERGCRRVFYCSQNFNFIILVQYLSEIWCAFLIKQDEAITKENRVHYIGLGNNPLHLEITFEYVC